MVNGTSRFGHSHGASIAVLTGATGGIGRFIALGLARAGHHVVLLCRDESRGQALQNWIAQRLPEASTEMKSADLRSLRATHSIGQSIAAAHPRIAVLVNNAGMFSARRQLTPEGIETVLAVNHLAPFVLTQALEPALRSGAPSRIIDIGSSTSDRARINPDDLQLARGWGMKRAYARSKLALMMASFARAEALRGTGVVSHVVHPGAVATGLIRETGPIGLAWRLMAPFMLTEEQGAETPLHAALAEEWQHTTGLYIKNRAAAPPNPRALDIRLRNQVITQTRALLQRP